MFKVFQLDTTNTSISNPLTTPPLLDTRILYTILQLAVAITIVIAIYMISGKILERLRLRRVISRKVEGMLKIIVLSIIIIIAVPLIASIYVQQSVLFSVVLLGIVLLVLAIAFRDYVANAAGYVIAASSGVVKDGDKVKIVIDGISYEGEVELLDSGFLQLRDENNTTVYIPYRKLLNATIVKYKYPLMSLNMRFHGHRIDIANLIEKIKEVLEGSTSVAEVYKAKPLELHEEYVTVHTEVGLKKDPSSFLLELYEKLSSEIQYRFEIEVL
jgi:small-conductance mechanosensitive channel